MKSLVGGFYFTRRLRNTDVVLWFMWPHISMPFSPCVILESTALPSRYMVKRCASEHQKFEILGICFCWN